MMSASNSSLDLKALTIQVRKDIDLEGREVVSVLLLLILILEPAVMADSAKVD